MNKTDAQAHADSGCRVCSAPLRHKRTGRPRKYCSSRCKQKAVRNRQIVREINALAIKVWEFPSGSIDWSDEDHRVT